MKQRRSLLLLLALVAAVSVLWLGLLFTASASASKRLDQRVQEVGVQLKCPVCQGESVADSPSLLAQQMRGVIRQQLQAGKSESEVLQYFANRYGEQIIWSPPWQGFSLLAWLVPVLLLLGGSIVLLSILRDWRMVSSATKKPIEDEHDEHDGALDAESDLAPYRIQLAQELAAEDVLFSDYRTEANS